MIKFTYTILYVKDVVKSIDFYERAFGFKRKFISPGNEYGELITGDVVLSFAAVSLANTNLTAGFIQSTPDGKPFGIEIGFTTEKVEEVYKEAIKAGAIAVEKAKTKHGAKLWLSKGYRWFFDRNMYTNKLMPFLRSFFY